MHKTIERTHTFATAKSLTVKKSEIPRNLTLIVVRINDVVLDVGLIHGNVELRSYVGKPTSYDDDQLFS